MTTKTIRRATRTDLEIVSQLVIEFLQSTAYQQHIPEIDNKHIVKMCYAVLQVGLVWLYEYEGVVVGLLIAVKEQNAWIPTKTSLRELVWYVREEYRKTPSAGKLFIEFCRTAEQMLVNKEIDGYFTTRMATTANYDLTKRGFREVERLFLRD